MKTFICKVKAKMKKKLIQKQENNAKCHYANDAPEFSILILCFSMMGKVFFHDDSS